MSWIEWLMMIGVVGGFGLTFGAYAWSWWRSIEESERKGEDPCP